MLIRKSRCLRGIVITILAGCMMFVLSAAAFAEESLKDQDVEETNEAYDYTVQTGGDSVGASASISSGGWASLGSKLAYMKFPEGVSGPDGEDGLWCYCIDISTNMKDGHKYSITSLDAANYYDDDAADKIRTILLNSYPNMTLEELEADYELTELMEEEAFMATQWIVWYYSNPDGEVDAGGGNYYPAKIYKPSDYPRETITMWYDDEEGNKVRKSSSNIVKLAKALDALAPAAAYETEPADIKFDKIVYDDKVIFDYSSSVGAETLENVKITIKDEQGRDVPFELKGSQVIVKHTALDFPEGTAKLTISFEGVQRLAKDVYFFSPEGGRDASQSGVAAYEGIAPVAKDAVFALTKEEFEEADEDPDKDDPETPTDPADPKEPAGGMGDGELLDPDESPETGDDNGRSVLLWAIIAAMSGAAAISVSRRKEA